MKTYAFCPVSDRRIDEKVTRINAILTVSIAILLFLNLYTIAITLTAMLLVFSFLEGVFGVCVACKLYPHIYKIAYQKNYKG